MSLFLPFITSNRSQTYNVYGGTSSSVIVMRMAPAVMSSLFPLLVVLTTQTATAFTSQQQSTRCLFPPVLHSYRPTTAFTPQMQSRRLLFPPTLRPTKQISFLPPNMYTFEQPFITTCNINARMTIIKLDKDTTVMYSPIAQTEECMEVIKSTVGRLPNHIIMHSNAVDHTLFLDGWRTSLPSATIYAVAPLIEAGDEPLLEDNYEGNSRVLLPSAWRAKGLDWALFDNGEVFQEVVFFHEASGTVLCGDAIWRVISEEYKPSIVARVGWRMFRVNNVSRYPYWFYFPKKEKIRAFVEKVSQWDIKRVIPAHLDMIMDQENAKEIFLGSFDEYI